MQGPGFAAEEAGWLQRMVNVFNAPQSSFAVSGARECARLLLPVAVTCLVGLGCHYLTIDTVSSLDAPAVQEKLINMSEEERAQYEHERADAARTGLDHSTCGTFLFAGFCRSDHAHCRPPGFSQRDDLSTGPDCKGVCNAGHFLVEWVVRALMVLATDSPFVFMGPGMFVGDEATATFFGRVLMNINFFDLWQLWIMGIGLSMLGSIDRQRAQWTLVALWVMWLFGGAGLEILEPQAGLSGVRGVSCIGRAHSPADTGDQTRAFCLRS